MRRPPPVHHLVTHPDVRGTAACIQGEFAATGVILLTALTLGSCSGSGSDSRVKVGANDTFDYGAKAADVAAAFGCAGVKPFQGALDSAFADAVTCTGASRIVLLVATCSDQGQYGTAIQAVFQHASEQGQGAAVAQGAFGSTGPPS